MLKIGSINYEALPDTEFANVGLRWHRFNTDLLIRNFAVTRASTQSVPNLTTYYGFSGLSTIYTSTTITIIYFNPYLNK